jgi:hypothetical protein
MYSSLEIVYQVDDPSYVVTNHPLYRARANERNKSQRLSTMAASRSVSFSLPLQVSSHLLTASSLSTSSPSHSFSCISHVIG